MTAVGGSIESLSLRGRIFAVPADTDATRKLGGWVNEVAANGNGTARIIKTREPLMIEGLEIEVDDTRADQEFLQEIADGQDFVAFAVTLASGVTYQGKCILTEAPSYSTQKSTASVSLSGPGKAEQQ